MGMVLANNTRLAAIFFLISGFLFLSDRVQAQETDYCITCAGPDQTYICRVTAKNGQSQGQQLFCIMNIAKEYGHDSCKAAAQSGGCSGSLVVYDVSNLAPATSVPPASQAAIAVPGQIAGSKVQAGKKKTPKTLVEFSKKTAKNTSKGFKSLGRNTNKAFKKTGQKISKFTKNVGKKISKTSKTTFKCITSLFTRCGN